MTGRYGRWNGETKECDFYHGNDWFRSLADGFALQTVASLRKIRFVRLQEVVASHSPSGLLSIGGDVGSPLFGLSILVHPRTVLVCWRGKTREECRRQLESLGFNNEEA